MKHFTRSNGVWNCPVMPIQKSGATIPAAIAEEAYKEYAAQFGTSQSLARLNERGGFGAEELAMLLFQRIERLQQEINSAYWNRVRDENTQLREENNRLRASSAGMGRTTSEEANND